MCKLRLVCVMGMLRLDKGEPRLDDATQLMRIDLKICHLDQPDCPAVLKQVVGLLGAQTVLQKLALLLSRQPLEIWVLLDQLTDHMDPSRVSICVLN